MPSSPDSPEAQEYRRRLFLFFSKYDPPRLKTLLVMIAKAEGKEKAFMSAMVKKYGPEPPYTPFSDEEKEVLRARLKAFYNKHDPHKLAGVETVINRYIGAEHELFAQLAIKYEGASAAPHPPAAAAAGKAKAPPTAALSKMKAPAAQPAAAASSPAAPSAAAVPSGGDEPASAAKELAALRERLVRFYQHYDPPKLGTVEPLLTKYGHEPSKLIHALVKKYGPEPEHKGHPIGGAASPPASPTRAKGPGKMPPAGAATVPSPTPTPPPPEEPPVAAAADGTVCGDAAEEPSAVAPADGSTAPDATKGEVADAPEGSAEGVVPEGGEETLAESLAPVPADGDEGDAAKAEPTDGKEAADLATAAAVTAAPPVIPPPPPPVIIVSLRLLTAAAFDYFEDATEALELSVQLFNLMEQHDDGGGGSGGVPNSVQVVDYLREQLGEEFIAYLRGFTASSDGVAALAAERASSQSQGGGGDGEEWSSALSDRLATVFAQFEPNLAGLARTLAQSCQGRADDLIVAIHSRYSAQFGELQRRDAIVAQFKRRVGDFVQYHCPLLGNLVSYLAETFKYNKEELMRELRRVYGPEPTIMDPAPVKLYTAARQSADAARLRTREGIMQQCLDHVRLWRYLSSTSALTNAGASTALGLKPSQWSSKLCRVVVGALLELFQTCARAIECIGYACGPEEVRAVGEEGDRDPTSEEIALVSECLTRNSIAVNPVFLLLNNDLVMPPPNTSISSEEALAYFIELCDEAFAPKPLSKAGRDTMQAYMQANPQLLRQLQLAGADGGHSHAGAASGQVASITSGILEAALEAYYEANGRDEFACLAALEAAYGPPPALVASSSTAGADEEDGGGGGGGLAGIGGGAANGGGAALNKNSTRQAQVDALVEDEWQHRRRIAFDQYCESSTAMARARTTIDALMITQRLTREMASWCVPKAVVMGNPLA